jgi:hypothetical protein
MLVLVLYVVMHIAVVVNMPYIPNKDGPCFLLDDRMYDPLIHFDYRSCYCYLVKEFLEE